MITLVEPNFLFCIYFFEILFILKGLPPRVVHFMVVISIKIKQ